MDKYKMNVIEGNRTGGYFPKVNTWRYQIKTGGRCTGLVSSRAYKSTTAAFEAGERMLVKLNNIKAHS